MTTKNASLLYLLLLPSFLPAFLFVSVSSSAFSDLTIPYFLQGVRLSRAEIQA
jgi:hypothetical protein